MGGDQDDKYIVKEAEREECFEKEDVIPCASGSEKSSRRRQKRVLKFHHSLVLLSSPFSVKALRAYFRVHLSLWEALYKVLSLCQAFSKVYWHATQWLATPEAKAIWNSQHLQPSQTYADVARSTGYYSKTKQRAPNSAVRAEGEQEREDFLQEAKLEPLTFSVL